MSDDDRLDVLCANLALAAARSQYDPATVGQLLEITYILRQMRSAHRQQLGQTVSRAYPRAKPKHDGHERGIYRHIEGCSCTHEEGDAECAVHPYCGECGASLESTRLYKALADALERIDKLHGDVSKMRDLYEATCAERDAAADKTAEKIAHWIIGYGSEPIDSKYAAMGIRDGKWR